MSGYRRIGSSFLCEERDLRGKYYYVGGMSEAVLVSASGKNERGHLLYNKILQDRIRRIKLFQQMGFTIKENDSDRRMKVEYLIHIAFENMTAGI